MDAGAGDTRNWLVEYKFVDRLMNGVKRGFHSTTEFGLTPEAAADSFIWHYTHPGNPLVATARITHVADVVGQWKAYRPNYKIPVAMLRAHLWPETAAA
jgi:hypothetical protein